MSSKTRDRACVTCGVEAGADCVSGNGKSTSFHNARIAGVQMHKGNQLRPSRRQ